MCSSQSNVIYLHTWLLYNCVAFISVVNGLTFQQWWKEWCMNPQKCSKMNLLALGTTQQMTYLVINLLLNHGGVITLAVKFMKVVFLNLNKSRSETLALSCVKCLWSGVSTRAETIIKFSIWVVWMIKWANILNSLNMPFYYENA